MVEEGPSPHVPFKGALPVTEGLSSKPLLLKLPHLPTAPRAEGLSSTHGPAGDTRPEKGVAGPGLLMDRVRACTLAHTCAWTCMQHSHTDTHAPQVHTHIHTPPPPHLTHTPTPFSTHNLHYYTFISMSFTASLPISQGSL